MAVRSNTRVIEVFSADAPAPYPKVQRHKQPIDWHWYAAAALLGGLVIGWLLGSSADFTRAAVAEPVTEVSAPSPSESLGAPTLELPVGSPEQQAVIASSTAGRLNRRVILHAGDFLGIANPSASDGLSPEIVWGIEDGQAVAARWDGYIPLGFQDGKLLAIGQSRLVTYEHLGASEPQHLLALSEQEDVLRALEADGLWLATSAGTLRYFNASTARHAFTYRASDSAIPHPHGLTPAMLLWSDDLQGAIPLGLSMLSSAGDIVPIDLSGREDFSVRGYSGDALVLTGDEQTDLFLLRDQAWLSVPFSDFPRELSLNAMVSPDRRYVATIIGSAELGKLVVIDVETGARPLSSNVHNPAQLPVAWLDSTTLLWLDQGEVNPVLKLADLQSNEIKVIAETRGGSAWRLFVEPES